MSENKRYQIKALLPIVGIGEGRARALVEAGITLATLPDTEVEDVLTALEGVGGDTPDRDEVQNWMDEGRQLIQLYEALRPAVINVLLEHGESVDRHQIDTVVVELVNADIGSDHEEFEATVLSSFARHHEEPGNGGGGDDGGPPPGDDGGEGMETETLFVRDIFAGNEAAYSQLDDRLHVLERKKKDQSDELEPDLEQERIAARVILAQKNPKLVIDPLYKAVQKYQRSCHYPVPDHQDGVLGYRTGDEGLQTLVAMYGIMQRENQKRPHPTEHAPNAIAIACDLIEAADADDSPSLYDDVLAQLEASGFDRGICRRYRTRSAGRRFSNALALAQAEYNRDRPLFHQTFAILRAEDGANAIESEKWARVTNVLSTKGIRADDPLLVLRTREALAGQISTEDGAFPSGIAIDLPDLEAEAEVEITEDNLHAMQAIYFSAMLDDANVYAVRDALMNNFRSGLLPFGRGHAGDILYRMIKEAPNRLSEFDRRNLYARTLGFPGGDTHNMVNRDFQTLWLRFVSAVSSFARQLSVDYLLKADVPMRVRQEQVKKAGRDLAANLSLYGYGVTYFAATELQTQINEMIELLSDEEVKSAYGARDMWGVVEQISALELGGARDTIRYRTMASAGAIIIRWLADNAKAVADVGIGNVLDVAEIQRPRVRPLGSKATLHPFDSDLVNACERWLAVTGTPDQQVETYAAPAEGPVQTSQPVRIPSVARDMLEAVGVNGSSV